MGSLVHGGDPKKQEAINEVMDTAPTMDQGEAAYELNLHEWSVARAVMGVRTRAKNSRIAHEAVKKHQGLQVEEVMGILELRDPKNSLMKIDSKYVVDHLDSMCMLKEKIKFTPEASFLLACAFDFDVDKAYDEILADLKLTGDVAVERIKKQKNDTEQPKLLKYVLDSLPESGEPEKLKAMKAVMEQTPTYDMMTAAQHLYQSGWNVESSVIELRLRIRNIRTANEYAKQTGMEASEVLELLTMKDPEDTKKTIDFDYVVKHIGMVAQFVKEIPIFKACSAFALLHENNYDLSKTIEAVNLDLKLTADLAIARLEEDKKLQAEMEAKTEE